VNILCKNEYRGRRQALMPYIEKFELARQRMLQADRALSNYLRSPFYNPEHAKQLADSVKTARDEFVASVASLLPEITPRPSGSVPLDSAPGEALDARHERRNPTLTDKEPPHPPRNTDARRRKSIVDIVGPSHG
jgi:hypothetical protein